MPNRNIAKLEPLADLLDSFHPDVVMLQECRAGWLEYICTRVGLTGVRAHDVLGDVGGLPADGTAVAVRAPLRITHASTLTTEDFAPDAIHALIGPDTLPRYSELPDALVARFRARSLIAEISGAGRQFAACSFHAAPGTGRYGPKPGKLVHEYKPFFHGGAGAALSRLNDPFIFAIDANEPKSETLEQVAFHWADGRTGARKMGALLGLQPVHPARDLQREQLKITGAPAASESYLALTYTTHNGGARGGRRFDSMWATPEFGLQMFSTHYQAALDAGTDHALLVADLEPAA
jgi:hypothetical protein